MTREDLVGEVYPDDQRVQFDGKDAERIEEAARDYTNAAVILIASLGEYSKALDAPVDGDSESRMGYARRQLIEDWSNTQAALSKIAWSLRFPADEAFKRWMKGVDEELPVDMTGL